MNVESNVDELEMNKKFVEIYQTKNLALLQLRYQLVGIIITILSASIGAVGFLINLKTNPPNSQDFHLIYSILFLWVVFSISLILVWRFITNLIHNEEYHYCREIQKLLFLIGRNKTESVLNDEEKQEMTRKIDECPRDPSRKKFEKWIFTCNYLLFIVAILILIMNRANYNIFNDGYWFLLSFGGILLTGIVGFAAIYLSQNYLKNQN